MDVLKRGLDRLASSVVCLVFVVSCNQAHMTGKTESGQKQPSTVGSQAAPKPPLSNPQPNTNNKTDTCVASAPGRATDPGAPATTSDTVTSEASAGGAWAAAGGAAAAAAAGGAAAAAASAGGAAAAAAAAAGAGGSDGVGDNPSHCTVKIMQ